MSTHTLITEGPISYPGGKNGWFRVYCTCTPGRFWWGATEIRAEKAGARDHKKAKEAEEAVQAQNLIPASEWRAQTLQWLTGYHALTSRPDLAEKLSEGDSVTLTYRELADIVDTVRINSKQR